MLKTKLNLTNLKESRIWFSKVSYRKQLILTCHWNKLMQNSSTLCHTAIWTQAISSSSSSLKSESLNCLSSCIKVQFAYGVFLKLRRLLWMLSIFQFVQDINKNACVSVHIAVVNTKTLPWESFLSWTWKSCIEYAMYSVYFTVGSCLK